MRRILCSRLRWPLITLAAAALILFTTTAPAGSGVGGVFNLGQTNTVNGTSTLTGATAGTQLNVKNTSTSSSASGLTGQSSSTTAAGVLGENLAGGPGLQAYVNTGAPPLKVNS